VKLFHFCFAANAVLWVSACTVPSPITAPTAISTADALIVADDFEPAFYRAFVHNGHEAPQRLEPMRILRDPFRIYLRTEDEAGSPIDQATLAATERTLVDTARVWSGGSFGVIDVERGTSTKEQIPGWITVKWSSAVTPDRCGRSTVGVDGGFIELNASGACSCGMASAVYPRLVRHELGHAMGYYHTDQVSDVMYGQAIAPDACDLLPSARERRHAEFAYAAPQ
jgi:hypothetical protein